jgi:hypothetical protein
MSLFFLLSTAGLPVRNFVFAPFGPTMRTADHTRHYAQCLRARSWPERKSSTHWPDLLAADGCSLRVNSWNSCPSPLAHSTRVSAANSMLLH